MPSYIAIHRDESGATRRLTIEDEVVAAARDATGVTWLHFAAIAADDIPLLQDGLGLHPLALEDCLHSEYQRPKIDDYGEYVFVLLHGIDYERTDEAVRTAELNLFVGRHFVVSSTVQPMEVIEQYVQLVQDHPASMPASAELVAHALIDALVDGILPIVDRMADVTDLIEEEALANPHPSILDHLIRLKRSVLRINRVTGPQRDLLGVVSRGTYPLLGGTNPMFFRDVYDHLVRVEDLTLGLRERADHAVAMYHSALSIKQNETMRVLSIVASIFLPLTLLAGVYGMNFEHMPELGWRWAYPAVLAFMLVAIAIGMYVLFGRVLLGWGRDRIGHLVSFAIDPPVIGDAVREAGRLPWRVVDAARTPRHNGEPLSDDDARDLAP